MTTTLTRRGVLALLLLLAAAGCAGPLRNMRELPPTQAMPPADPARATLVFAQEHWPDIQEKKQKYLPEWQTKADKPALRPGDGR